ncbi:MAG: acetylxylan esterase, partial [Verrucomicrobia bacterium]|nr:acetylxylan esterase [Verrucomicrobiota bacterium]
MNNPKRWGFFSPQAEANLQSIMGLQTWNSIRSLDFLLTLPDIDPERLSITGASGGGTQSFMMGALDDRLAACFPAVMVSTAMQGGCTCENASGLRIPVGNVEIAALVAPKPLGMTGANDWTVEMSTKGFPELKKLFGLYDREDYVSLAQLNQFGHNYNYVSRSAMYHFMNRHLNLNLSVPIVEQDYKRLNKPELTVWSSGHKTPDGGPDFERDLIQHWHQDIQKKLNASHQSPHAFRNLHGPGIEAIIGRTLSNAGEIELELTQKGEKDGYLEMAGILKNATYGEAVPTLFLHPSDWNGRTLIWPTLKGKSGLFRANGKPRPVVQRALKAGCTVIGLDLFLQGEFLDASDEMTQNRLVSNPREFAGYTYGYNSPLFAQRVHDLVTLIAYVHRNEKGANQSIELVGLNGAGHWAAAARAVSRDVIHKSAIQTQGFRFSHLTDFRDVNFLHGGAKYGDLPGMLAQGAPSLLWIAGEDKDTENLLKGIYASSGFPDRVTIAPEGNTAKAVTWLLKQD